MMFMDREMLIARYLDGRMTPSEQREFLDRVGADVGLRRELEMEQAIRATMGRERSAMPANHAKTRANAMAMLATVKPPAVPAPDPASTIGGGSGSSLFAGSTMKIVTGAIAVVGVTVGTFLLMPRQSGERPAAVPPGSVQQARPENARENPVSPSSSVPAPATPSQNESAERSVRDDGSREKTEPRIERKSRTTAEGTHNAESNRPADAPPVIATPTESAPPENASQPRAQKKSPPVIIRSDTANTRMIIKKH